MCGTGSRHTCHAAERGKTPLADPVQMKTLFTCLVSNSTKFTSDSISPNVTIEASENAGRWAFKISDNGIGIEAKHCHSVFEVFKKAVSGDLYPGRGIGLALA